MKKPINNIANHPRKIKGIADWGLTILCALIGAVLMVAVFFGAAIQEQNKLAEMAVCEVSE